MSEWQNRLGTIWVAAIVIVLGVIGNILFDEELRPAASSFLDRAGWLRVEAPEGRLRQALQADY
jgi:hypothetical protein